MWARQESQLTSPQAVEDSCIIASSILSDETMRPLVKFVRAVRGWPQCSRSQATCHPLLLGLLTAQINCCSMAPITASQFGTSRLLEQAIVR